MTEFSISMLVVSSICAIPGFDSIYSTATAPLIKNVLPDRLVLLIIKDSRYFQNPQKLVIIIFD
jgi:hypothetical protein